jgi:hypothetical protein
MRERAPDLGDLTLRQVTAENSEDNPNRIGAIDGPDVVQALPNVIEEMFHGPIFVGPRHEMPLMIVGAPHEDGQLRPGSRSATP